MADDLPDDAQPATRGFVRRRLDGAATVLGSEVGTIERRWMEIERATSSLLADLEKRVAALETQEGNP